MLNNQSPNAQDTFRWLGLVSLPQKPQINSLAKFSCFTVGIACYGRAAMTHLNIWSSRVGETHSWKFNTTTEWFRLASFDGWRWNLQFLKNICSKNYLIILPPQWYWRQLQLIWMLIWMFPTVAELLQVQRPQKVQVAWSRKIIAKMKWLV